ncbi:hypothetical protein BB558_005450 [Smittium angustum]|uniref:Uncharacterized protein n=1 Tax=Smittium angustum TaxID=133377 RepID=A0A2U1J0H4_SMIAN|nr:hypothetical protein BB558_005450 [Smittium angustum]
MIKTILFAGLFALTSYGQNTGNIKELDWDIYNKCSTISPLSMEDCIKDHFNENGFGQYFDDIDCGDTCDTSSDVYPECMRKCYVRGLRDILEEESGAESAPSPSDKLDNEITVTPTDKPDKESPDNSSDKSDNKSTDTPSNNSDDENKSNFSSSSSTVSENSSSRSSSKESSNSSSHSDSESESSNPNSAELSKVPKCFVASLPILSVLVYHFF